MKFAFPSFRFPRRAARWLAWLAGSGVVLFVAIAAAVYFWLLPNIASYREPLAGLMSRALGQRVTLEAVSGQWQQARPEITLRGVRLYDQHNRSALYLEQLDASFAWRSLLFLEPRFTRLALAGPALAIRRARDGYYYVGGLAINPNAADSPFSDWLLKQGEVHISRATLSWSDEVREAPMLILRNLDCTLENHFHRHQLQLRATPPSSLATPFTLNADLNGRSLSDHKAWSGTLRGSLGGVALPLLASWVDLPYPAARGWGAANVLLELKRGALSGVSVGLNARDVSVTLGTALPPLNVAHMHGALGWNRQGKKQRVDINGLSLNLSSGAVIPAFDVSAGWDGSTRELSAKNLNLATLYSLLPALPVTPTLRQTVQDMQLGGHVDELQLRWQGERPGDAGFDVTARFTGLRLAASGSRPGISNVSGSVRGDEQAGVVELQGASMLLDLPMVFRDPRLPLDSMLARGGWKKRANGTLFTIAQLDFANADAAGSGHGSYESVSGHAGIVDLSARLSRGNGTAVYRYLPKVLSEQTVAWVKRAVVAGTSDDTQLTLVGDLDRFPFHNDQGGVFKVAVKARGAVIDYVEGWPRIEGIDALVLFHGKRMEVNSETARIFNAQLAPVKAVIPDLSVAEEVLEISGQASGSAQDFIRFSNFSPVGEILTGLTDGMDGNGNMALALNLKIPLRHSDATTLGGRLSFRGNTLFPAGLPRLDQVRGDMVFTHESLVSEGLNAQFLGGPVAINTSTRDGHAVIQANGRASSAGLAPWLGKTWSARLAGEANWHGQVVLDKANTQVRIESDLVGMESRLPAPLNKPAAQALPLIVTRQPQAGNEQLLEVQLGRTLGAIWQTTADNRISRGEIRFGGAARLPQEPGLRLAGSGRGLDLSDWMSFLPSNNDEASLPISFIDLSVGTLDLMGRRFPEVRVQGRTRGGMLRMTVSGRDMSGTLTYRPAERLASASSARVSAQFKQLTIPAESPASVGGSSDEEGINMKAIDIPVLDLTVEDFRLEDRAMGRLEALAHGAPQGLVIDNLQLSHADSVVRMSGLWRDVGKGETRATLQVDVIDAGKMLSRFGFKDAVKRGAADISGDVTWEGTPADFGFRTLAGTLNFKAKNGQFLKVDPGAAKLLGVLSLQSLPRRLSFDFRDIFNDGFAFDEISATMRVARGVVYSDDFRMKGPAAKVAMSGLARLTDETVQLRVKVSPKLSEGVAVAGALIGGPIAGLGVLAAQKLLRDPFEEATSQEYIVTGPWREPDVSKLNKPKKQDGSKENDGG
ncbi:MAG: YhdP family protein [Thiobacillaceae bacterium]